MGLAVAAAAWAGPATAPTRGPGELTDYGPFLSFTFLRSKAATPAPSTRPGLPLRDHGWEPVERAAGAWRPAATDAGPLLAVRGIAVKLPHDASICFDCDLLSFSGGWVGGYLDLARTDIAQYKGDQPARAKGDLAFSTVSPGWSADGRFDDPRPDHQGPLPAATARYGGLYRAGDRVTLAYAVAGAQALETPGVVIGGGGEVGFTRTIRLSHALAPLWLNVCQPLNAGASVTINAAGDALMRDGDRLVRVAVRNAPAGATLVASTVDGVALKLPPIAGSATFELVIAGGDRSKPPSAALFQAPGEPLPDPASLCKGGGRLWGEPIITHGSRGADAGPYAIDTVALPEENPMKSWMRTTAVDFFSDGRAAVATMGGDVWIVSGLDDSLASVRWQRFATGLYEPLGLKIVEDQIYVLGRDQITRLSDLNGDGEADYYENFCNAWVVSPAPHGFNLDLQVDSAGNFYFGNCGNSAPLNVRMQQSLLKVSKYGGACEVFATGLRAPNGFGMGPRDELVFSDNQGHWTPVCRINLARRGGFYGFVADPARTRFARDLKIPASYDPPICWIPMNIDNSTGGQVWAPAGWGALGGQMLSTSYGMSALYEVLWEQVNGVPQGGVVRLPYRFDSGIMRARVNPRDGQVWVTGMKGWQTNARRDGCLQRVRATGRAAHLPTALHVTHDALTLTFSDPLDPDTASDEQSYGIEQWNYRWTANYGSPDIKASDPHATGHDEVKIRGVKLSSDHKTVTLGIDGLKPVMQMVIRMHLLSADAAPIDLEVDNTINAVP